MIFLIYISKLSSKASEIELSTHSRGRKQSFAYCCRFRTSPRMIAQPGVLPHPPPGGPFPDISAPPLCRVFWYPAREAPSGGVRPGRPHCAGRAPTLRGGGEKASLLRRPRASLCCSRTAHRLWGGKGQRPVRAHSAAFRGRFAPPVAQGRGALA